MQKWVKGEEVRAPTPIEAYVEAEGGIGIHVDPPVTLVLDTGDFRVALMVVMMATAAIFAKRHWR